MADTLPLRGSMKSRGAAAISTVTLRQVSAVLPPERAWGLWAARRIVSSVMDTFGPSLAGTQVEHVDVRMPRGGRLVGEWVLAAGVRRGDCAIYYVHGSGYALCSPRTHRRLTAWLSALTGLPVFVVDYRLAPRHRFPTAATDVRTGWDWLTAQHGLAPQRLIIAGDSAGGHLAVDMLLQSDVVHPAAMVLMSPLIDLSFELSRTREALRRDPAIRVRDAKRLVGLYCARTDLVHPRLMLDVAGGRPMPPTLVQAGGAEMLVSDARRLAADICAAGGECELQVWPDQVHVFQALPRLTPEAAPAMEHIAGFIAGSLPRAPSNRKQGDAMGIFGSSGKRSHKSAAVITGAGSGIGAAFATELARRGGRVVCSDIDESAARTTADGIVAAGGEAWATRCDVAQLEDVIQLAKVSQDWLGGPPTVVVNNAGVGAGGAAIGETEIDDWNWVLGINLWGPIHGCHVFAPILREGGRGGIINVASAAAFGAAPGMAAYNVSKAGVLSLSETLSAELSGTGVNVTVLCPTFVKTNIVDSGRMTEKSTQMADRLMRWTGFSPERVARACLDTFDRGGLYCMPQPDARIGWGIKRFTPTVYTRAAGLSTRFATQ